MIWQPIQQLRESTSGRPCLREAIPEFALAAKYLDDAVTAHISANSQLAADLINMANMPAIRDWAESLWGKASPYNQHWLVADAPPSLEKAQRVKARMPSRAEKALLHDRDGYHCTVFLRNPRYSH